MLERDVLHPKTTPTRETLIAEARAQMGVLLRVFYQRFRQPKQPEIFELTMPQCRAVLYLQEGPAHMSRLAAGLGVALPSATGIVDRLVERGLVSREEDPEDRRVVLCCLTPGGQHMAMSLYEADVAVLEELLQGLPEQELLTISEGLGILLREASRQSGSHQHETSGS